ncbi:hypothetical protein [Burkholderia gladioli]|uniref:hypothetical protein n=1 Tax=Burkholderia gladioli TaxID=28095 RepID=UPI000A62DC7B|nr:hypothetical protein [Burkholderia gladioli]
MSSHSCSFPAQAFATLADFIEARLPELLQDWAAARAVEDGRQHAVRSLPHTGAELLRSLLVDLRGDHANARMLLGLGIETAIAELGVHRVALIARRRSARRRRDERTDPFQRRGRRSRACRIRARRAAPQAGP